MPLLTVLNTTSRPVVLGRSAIPPRTSRSYDTLLFATDPMEGGLILSLFQSGTVRVSYMGLSLTESKLRNLLVLPSTFGTTVAGPSCPPTPPPSFDVTQYAVFLDDLTNDDSVPLLQGMTVRISGDEKMERALADTLANLRPALGVVDTVSVSPTAQGRVQLSGAFATARMLQGLTLQSGDTVFVSANPLYSGLLTNVPPTADGNVIQEIGYVVDAAVYNPIDPTPVARILVRVQEPIVYHP